MSSDLYFRNLHVPKRANHWWHLIKDNNGRLYYIHTSGRVAVRYKNGKERFLTPFMHHDKDLVVKIVGKNYKVKNLVAAEIFPDYIPGEHSVLFVDGNPKNCDCYNLEIYTKEQLGRITGGTTQKTCPVMIDGKKYPSVRAAAKALFVSYQTLLDYFKTGKSNVIDKTRKIILVKN